MGNLKCPYCLKLNFVITHDYVTCYIVYCKACEKSFVKCKEKKTETGRIK